ncbi:MAG: S1C family serine protease [Roseburia sp.]|nr:S1C family serine protease [Roseburia sp.]
MSESEPNQQSDFMIEKIKERPINKKRLIRRTLITAVMAVIFGLVACFTFIALEPVISSWMYPEEPPPQVAFPEDPEEMSPEDMLADNLPQEDTQEAPDTEQEVLVLDEEQIQQILSGVTLDLHHYNQLYDTMSQYVQELNRCMVTITGIYSNVDWLNNVQESQNQSSGVFIAGNIKELFVLTEYTPIQGAEKLMLSPAYDSDISVPAEVKAYDIITDLAVLSVNIENMPTGDNKANEYKIAKLGSSNVRLPEGTPIVALGSPMGNTGSVAYGMITSTGGQFSAEDSNYKLLQTDISGSQKAWGVLFNLQSEVVGIITSRGNGYDMKNLINAYGITDLKRRLEKMSNGEALSYIGITGGSVTTALHNELGIPYGAYIQKVTMDSPAMLAGIQQGDVITKMDGRSIASFGEYTNILLQLETGSSIEMTVMRQVQDEYKEMTLHVTLGQI